MLTARTQTAATAPRWRKPTPKARKVKPHFVIIHALVFPAVIVMAFSFMTSGCREARGGDSHSHSHGGHDHADHGGHDHGAEEAPSESFTVWTDDYELFVEHEPLVPGNLAHFNVHLTRLADYKPVKSGKLSASLVVGDKGIRHSVDAPARPGIFQPALRATAVGTGRLILELNGTDDNARFVIEDVQVYPDDSVAQAALAAHADDDEISLTKEQAWSIDFGVNKVGRGDMHDVIRAGGHFRAMQGDEIVVSAKTAGIVLFNGRQVFTGTKMEAGQLLFRISGEGLTDASIKTHYREAKTELDRAQADYDRAEKLLYSEVISRSEYDAVKAALELARTEYESVVDNYEDGAQLINAPVTAYVKNILVEEGQFVENGAPLLVLTKNRRMVLEADVSQRYFSELPAIRTANFRTAYSEAVHSIEELNGRLLSYGKNTIEGNGFIPVFFEIDNKGDLLAGAFVDVFLKTTPLKAVLLVPRSAVMEDYEHHYVYVQSAGETFEKRTVELGVDDGEFVQVRSGLNEGEVIVTEGAYRVKMAAMSGSIPSHGHSH